MLSIQFIGFATLLAISSSFADRPTDASGLRMEVRIVPDNASRGEPLVAECILINEGPRSLSVIHPNATDEWLTVSGLASSDVNMRIPPQELPAARPPLASFETIQPGGRAIRRSVISRRLPPLSPGDYKATIVANLWAYEPDKERIWDSVRPTATTTFKITAINVSRLRSMAIDLAAKSCSNRSKESAFAIQKLFCLPEDVALPVWRDLVRSDLLANNSEAWRISAELERLATPAAIQLLLEMWQKDLPSGRGMLARQSLEHMSYTLNGDSARKIQQIFLKVEGRIPKRPTVKYENSD